MTKRKKGQGYFQEKYISARIFGAARKLSSRILSTQNADFNHLSI
jgi:hypothetical protein